MRRGPHAGDTLARRRSASITRREVWRRRPPTMTRRRARTDGWCSPIWRGECLSPALSSPPVAARWWQQERAPTRRASPSARAVAGAGRRDPRWRDGQYEGPSSVPATSEGLSAGRLFAVYADAVGRRGGLMSGFAGCRPRGLRLPAGCDPAGGSAASLALPGAAICSSRRESPWPR